MPQIIAGVDGSDHSQRALEWAVREATVQHLPLVVIAVYQTAANFWGSASAYPEDPDPAEHARKSAQAQADDALGSSGGPRPVSVTVRVASGTPADELLSSAGDADMIVVGSRGAGGFTRLQLGSVASHLAHHAPCPVVIIPAKERD
jgi:nucleotide-binding universal stress UspA family protein